MNEKTLFKQNNVTVSTTSIVIGKASYPICSVNSVKLEVIKPGLWWVVFAVIAAACLFVGKQWLDFGLLSLAVALLLLAFRASRYAVVLNTSTGKKQILVSKDKAYTEGVVMAIFDALAGDVIEQGLL